MDERRRTALRRSRAQDRMQPEREAGRDAGCGDAGRRLEDLRRRRDPPGDRGRPARVRRKPRAGSAGQMAGAEGGIPGHRAASDRPAAVQQGEGSRRAVRRHRDRRPREDRRRARRGDRRGRASTPRLYVQVNTGSEPQKAGIAPRRGRRLRRPLPRSAWPRHRRPDVHSAGRREPRPAFRAAGEARQRSRRRKSCRWACPATSRRPSPSAPPASGSARRSSAAASRSLANP